MQNTLVNVNGQILPPEKAQVSVFDRGFLYGDSLYEVVRSYGGTFFKLDEHIQRLFQSAQYCRMTLGQKPADYRKEILKTLTAFRQLPGMSEEDAYCRIIVSRGTGKIGFGLNCLTSSTQYIIIMQPIRLFRDSKMDEAWSKGLKLQISERIRNDRRALDPAMKSGNYLNNLLAYLEASTTGFDDAILQDTDGHITEGTTFNLFYARRGILATPPTDIGILVGITRAEVITLARNLGIACREVRFPRERLYEADEVFITSSIKEVYPVTVIDQKKIANGKPGPITQKLQNALRSVIHGTA